MNQNNSFQEIQNLLSIGYIYLIVIGILSQTLYYNQVGISILRYSNVLDILISPITIITSSIVSLSVFSILVLTILNLPKYIAKRKDKNWVKKAFTIDENLPVKEIENLHLKSFSFIFALGLFGFFIGTGLGHGWKVSGNIETGEIKYEDQLNFVNGDKEEVKILGTNSSYIFYLKNDSKVAVITPINGVVKSIYEK